MIVCVKCKKEKTGIELGDGVTISVCIGCWNEKIGAGFVGEDERIDNLSSRARERLGKLEKCRLCLGRGVMGEAVCYVCDGNGVMIMTVCDYCDGYAEVERARGLQIGYEMCDECRGGVKAVAVTNFELKTKDMLRNHWVRLVFRDE